MKSEYGFALGIAALAVLGASAELLTFTPKVNANGLFFRSE